MADCLNVERSGFDVAPGPSTRVASAGPDEGRCPTLRLRRERPRRRAGHGLRARSGLWRRLRRPAETGHVFWGDVSGGQLAVAHRVKLKTATTAPRTPIPHDARASGGNREEKSLTARSGPAASRRKPQSRSSITQSAFSGPCGRKTSARSGPARLLLAQLRPQEAAFGRATACPASPWCSFASLTPH